MGLRGWRSGFTGLRGHWPGRIRPGDHNQVRRLWRRFRCCSTASRLLLSDYDVLFVELVASDPTSSVAAVRVIASFRLRSGFHTVEWEGAAANLSFLSILSLSPLPVRLTPSTAPMVRSTGRRGGQPRRSSGAVSSMARDAGMMKKLLLPNMIAMLPSAIG